MHQHSLPEIIKTAQARTPLDQIDQIKRTTNTKIRKKHLVRNINYLYLYPKKFSKESADTVGVEEPREIVKYQIGDSTSIRYPRNWKLGTKEGEQASYIIEIERNSALSFWQKGL